MHLASIVAATVAIVLYSLCSAMHLADKHCVNNREVRQDQISGGDDITTASTSCSVAGVADSGLTPRVKDKNYRSSRPQLSQRVRETEPAHIEAVLLKYADMIPPPANLAQV